MNAVEIEEAVSSLAGAPFEPEEFPFAFLEAFGNKPTTIKKLKSKSGSSNQSDIPGGILQRNNIHLKVCPEGQVTATLTALRESPATSKYKAKFILATDGKSFEAENLADGETIACAYGDFHDHFGFFLPLAGITTVKQIRENAFDIKATGRLNRLYIELLKDNPDWDTAEWREEMNHFMARLIFCFFAEDTNIFHSDGLFTATVAQMSARYSSNTHEVLSELFRAMRSPLEEREKLGIRNWADRFPYVNGGLFSPHPLTPSLNMEEGQGNQTLFSSSERESGGEGAYWEISPALKKKMTEVARQFRKNPTPSENILWQALRGRKLEGRKFRRQQPIGAFIVDFFCGAERLIVEVDGGVHDSQQEADRQRQELLESLGLRVVRVSSELVETSLDEALAAVRQGFSPHPLTSSPKLEEGQDNRTLFSSSGKGSGGEEARSEEYPHPLTPSPKLEEGEQEKEAGQENLTPLSFSRRGAGGEVQVPRFSKIARSYLLHVGNLDWKQINPDIFGSMIQAVADEEERGALGMHYTSVPNILKVLNPLFLDDLRVQLEAAGDNGRKLLNLRQRMAKIRVFDPACGSGNFLVIAYKEMRAIEAEINRRRGEPNRKSEIPLTNFRGIEIRHFAAEIARLALIIAEYQCDVLYLGQQEARLLFLPLKQDNWITCGNALRLDWLSLCPPTGTGVKVQRQDLDLWGETQEQAQIEFENEGGETYICGNPPYLGSTWQSKEQKDDLKLIFDGRTKTWKSLDYVAGWLMKAADYGTQTRSAAAFVSTNSICQGQQVPILWPLIFKTGHEIAFAHTSFKWANLASHNAGVTVVIVGISNHAGKVRYLFSIDDRNQTIAKEAENINAYLVSGASVIVEKITKPLNNCPEMLRGNIPADGGNLYLSVNDKNEHPELLNANLIRLCLGSDEFIAGKLKYCLWLLNIDLEIIKNNNFISKRLALVSQMRISSTRLGTRNAVSFPHLFLERRQVGDEEIICIPAISSENREYLPIGLLPAGAIITGKMYGIFNAPLWNMALIASRLHWVWIGTVCVRMRTDFSYSNTLGWNTFPVPTLTEQNKTDLSRCAEDILLAREHYFPATIADMYDSERMDSEFPLVREAHERNDETLERIYIGRRFKNDTERLEKLFEMYTKMTSQKAPAQKSTKRK